MFFTLLETPMHQNEEEVRCHQTLYEK